MSFDASQALRYAMDQGLAVPSILGVCEYAVYLYTLSNDQIDLDHLTSVSSVSTQRILIADGYRSYAAGDGYLNPMVKEDSTSVLLGSNAVFTSKTVTVGPIVMPYNLNNLVSGYDPNTFAPPTNSTNLQYWIQLVGPGILGGYGQGSFYDINEIRLSDMGNLSFYLIIKATGTNPPGVVS
jgi:hypothetical protein